nr:hypothetical protein GZ17A3_16 [uncultured archaeon GZfos17A3]
MTILTFSYLTSITTGQPHSVPFLIYFTGIQSCLFKIMDFLISSLRHSTSSPLTLPSSSRRFNACTARAGSKFKFSIISLVMQPGCSLIYFLITFFASLSGITLRSITFPTIPFTSPIS